MSSSCRMMSSDRAARIASGMQTASRVAPPMFAPGAESVTSRNVGDDAHVQNGAIRRHHDCRKWQLPSRSVGLANVGVRPTPDSDSPNPGASKQSNTVAESQGLMESICRAVRLMQFTLPSRLAAFGCTQIPHCSNSAPIPMPEARFARPLPTVSSAAIRRSASGRVPKVDRCTGPSGSLAVR